jgi:hypothetical protein
MNARSVFVVGVAAILLLGACQTDNSGSGATTGRSGASAMVPRNADLLIPAAKVNAIAKGMTADEVRALLGAPERVEPYSSAGATAKVWIYTLAVETKFHQVSTGMQEIPSYDPITGAATVIREPIMANRRVKRYTTLELLMVDDRLVERRPGRSVDVNFD